MSPGNLVHIPRKFFEENYDTAHILKNGITIQIQVNGGPVVEVSSPVACVSHNVMFCKCFASFLALISKHLIFSCAVHSRGLGLLFQQHWLQVSLRYASVTIEAGYRGVQQSMQKCKYWHVSKTL